MDNENFYAVYLESYAHAMSGEGLGNEQPDGERSKVAKALGVYDAHMQAPPSGKKAIDQRVTELVG